MVMFPKKPGAAGLCRNYYKNFPACRKLAHCMQYNQVYASAVQQAPLFISGSPREAADPQVPKKEVFQMTEANVTIENKTGIHARPASVFVQTATKFKSKVQIKAKGKTVDAKSILMIMSMGLVKGTDITIVADGPDEAEAVKALKDLVLSKFGEE